MEDMRGFGSTYQRGKIWWVSFWRQGKRTRESVGSEKKTDAIDVLKRRFAEAKSELPPTALTLTVRHLYGALELDYVINHRCSLRNVRQMWDSHLKAAFGTVLAHLLTPGEITVYIAARQKEGAENSTINRELACLRRIFTLAMRTGSVTIKPYIPMLQEDNVRLGTLSPAHYEVIAIETARIGLWFRALFETAYTHGIRRGALLGMLVKQIDMEKKTITMEPGSGTKRKPRTIVMTGKVFELIRQCCAGKGSNQLVFTREHERNGRKTKHPDGRISDFRKDWERVTAIAGCPEIIFHDLRRTALTNMIDDGVDEKTAMRISGHKTRSVFDRYHIVKEGALREAAAKVERGARERHEREVFAQAEMFEEEKKPALGTGSEPGKESKVQ